MWLVIGQLTDLGSDHSHTGPHTLRLIILSQFYSSTCGFPVKHGKKVVYGKENNVIVATTALRSRFTINVQENNK